MSFRLVPRSLKYRLLLAFLLGMIVIEVAASYLAYRLMERHTWNEFDRVLEEKVQFYRGTLFYNHEGKGLSRMGEADWERIFKVPDPDYFEIRFPAPDARTISRSKTLVPKSSEKGEILHLPAVGMESESLVFENVTLPRELMLTQGGRGRAAGGLGTVKHYLTRNLNGESRPEPIHIVVARSTISVERALGEVRWRLIVAAFLGTLGLLGTAFFIIRRNVRSASELSSQIEIMPLDEPGRRFELPGAPSELAKVVGRLNALMDRVAVAIENERQFTSNAAHELRTPLAGMRSTIEAALSRTRTVEEYETTLLKLKDMQWKLQRLTENLLLLARLDAGQSEFGSEEILLKQLMRRAWKPYFDAALDKNLNISWQVEEPETAQLLPSTLLDIVARNLFQNAVDYSPEGGRIEIHGRIAEGTCIMRVANTNPGLQPEEVARMFQRFWRADQSGDPNLASTGIGLALCQRILGALKGSITAEIVGDQLICIHCHFPLPPGTT